MESQVPVLHIRLAGIICALELTEWTTSTAPLVRLKAFSCTTGTRQNISAPTKMAMHIYLTAENNYILHFNKEEIPPTLENGFWSITMYGSDFQLVKNRMNRFSIGDRTEGIVYGRDGYG